MAPNCNDCQNLYLTAIKPWVLRLRQAGYTKEDVHQKLLGAQHRPTPELKLPLFLEVVRMWESEDPEGGAWHGLARGSVMPNVCESSHTYCNGQFAMEYAPFHPEMSKELSVSGLNGLHGLPLNEGVNSQLDLSSIANAQNAPQFFTHDSCITDTTANYNPGIKLVPNLPVDDDGFSKCSWKSQEKGNKTTFSSMLDGPSLEDVNQWLQPAPIIIPQYNSEAVVNHLPDTPVLVDQSQKSAACQAVLSNVAFPVAGQTEAAFNSDDPDFDDDAYFEAMDESEG